jgi:hypothetical protein
VRALVDGRRLQVIAKGIGAGNVDRHEGRSVPVTRQSAQGGRSEGRPSHRLGGVRGPNA